jgi:4-amino-4-deoxy-L-arabinose transferase-like glycosyltransferase
MKLNNFQIQSSTLILILVIAAIMRLYRIDQPFTDMHAWRESSTAMMAENIYHNWNIFYPEVNWDGPGPSYNGREFQTVTFLAALLYKIFGQQDWIGRSIAVMFGVWGVFALYKLMSHVWDQERAVMGAIVMAVLPGSFFVDREFLPDPGMVALVTTGCWFLVSYLETERLHYLVITTIISSLGFLTKLTGLIVGLPMLYAIITILRSRRPIPIKQIIKVSLAVFLTLLIVISYYLWGRYLALNYPPYHFAGEHGFIWHDGLQEWLNKNYFLPTLQRLLKEMWTKIGLILLFIGLFLRFPQNDIHSISEIEPEIKAKKTPWFFHWWLLGGGSIYYLIGADHLIGQCYNFHLFDPPVAALIGHSIFVISSFLKRVINSSAALGILIAILLIIAGQGEKNIQHYYNFYPEDDYKLGLALSRISQPEDIVITMDQDIGSPVSIYYSNRHGWIFPPESWEFSSQVDSNWDEGIKDDSEAIRILETLRDQGADWLGIVNSQKTKIWQENPQLVTYIEKTFELSEVTSQYIIYDISAPRKVL